MATSKKRATKKRATKKRATKKRATKKRATKKVVASAAVQDTNVIVNGLIRHINGTVAELPEGGRLAGAGLVILCATATGEVKATTVLIARPTETLAMIGAVRALSMEAESRVETSEGLAQ